jgi:hypothetical protein
MAMYRYSVASWAVGEAATRGFLGWTIIPQIAPIGGLRWPKAFVHMALEKVIIKVAQGC